MNTLSTPIREPRKLVLALPEKFGSGIPSLPSPNMVHRWLRLGQRWRFGDLSKAYSLAILEAKAMRGVPWGVPATRVRVTVCRSASRLFDPDNLTGSVKSLLDSLVKAGIVVNDRPENLSLAVSQERVTKPRGAKTPMPWRGVKVVVEEVLGA